MQAITRGWASRCLWGALLSSGCGDDGTGQGWEPDSGSEGELVDIVPAETTSFELPNAGTWAISAAARTGVESRGVLVEVP